jgi:hypothetical protein
VTLHYTNTAITHHTATLIPGANVWSLSWTPGMFRFRQAVDAILLAELSDLRFVIRRWVSQLRGQSRLTHEQDAVLLAMVFGGR